MRQRNLFAALFPMCTLAVLAGCGPSGDPPYAGAMAELEERAESVREAFTAGTPEDAHVALHEIGDILDKFPTMVDGTNLTPADRETVKNASNELFDAYTELDMTMHGGDEVKYEDLSEEIEANLAILKGKVAAAGDAGEPIVVPDRDHDEHGHAHDDEHAHDHAHDDAHDHDHADHDHDHDGIPDHAPEDQVHADDHEHADGEADHEHAEEAATETRN